jgi:hypothetical protein
MNKVCLIDADSMIFITIFSIQSKPELNSDDFGIYKKQIDDWIIDTITKTESTHYNLFLTIGKVFRHTVAINKEYKSGRPKNKPKFYYELREHLITKWQASYQDGLEAEDLVAVAQNYNLIAGNEVVIARIDHDFDQVEGIHYNYKKGEFTTITKQEAEYNLWKMLLVGCSTDKIEGIPGVGDKKADKILENCSDSKQLKERVLDCYTSKFGYLKGVELFAETFKLIYLLRTQQEIIECPIRTTIPYLTEVKEEIKPKDEF